MMARAIWGKLFKRYNPTVGVSECRDFLLASVGCFCALTVSGSRSFFYFVVLPPESFEETSSFGSSSSRYKVLQCLFCALVYLRFFQRSFDALYAVSINSPPNTPYIPNSVPQFYLFIF